MVKVSYSTRGQPSVEQLLDTDINQTTLVAGDTLLYDATNSTWINGAGGGGGGVIGLDDDALFKQGGNSNTFTGGISINPAAGTRAIVLDPTNYRVGIGGANNAINPVNTLEVDGGQRLKNGAEELVLDSNTLGMINLATTLRLYSNNDLTAEAITEVDGTNKCLNVGGTMATLPPALFDVPNSTNTTGLYKLKLQLGNNLATLAVPPFEVQEALNSGLGFPQGQVQEYNNTLPLSENNNRIIGRIATGVLVVPGAGYRIGNFGTQTAFTDRMVYDPANMRTRKIGTGWYYAGTPNKYRVPGTMGGMILRVYFDGHWGGGGVAGNRVVFYVHQYRNAVLLRSFKMANNADENECIMNGYRSLLGWGTFGEDWDVMTDDLDAEIINSSPVGGNDLLVNLGQVEYEFRLSV